MTCTFLGLDYDCPSPSLFSLAGLTGGRVEIIFLIESWYLVTEGTERQLTPLASRDHGFAMVARAVASSPLWRLTTEEI